MLAETLWAELKPHGVDATCQLVGATNGANYKWFQETLDPELCKNRESDDPLDVARWRLINPVEPAVSATTSTTVSPTVPCASALRRTSSSRRRCSR